VTDPDTPIPETPASKLASWLDGAFSQANLTTALAVLAVILAGAPYVVPKVQAWLVRGGLMERPTMLIDAQAELTKKKDAAELAALTEGARSHMQSLFNTPGDPILGNPAAPIKIVEFLDYNCLHCRKIEPHLKAYLAANSDVALIVKEYPVISANSPTLALYALAAAKQGKYAEMHDALMNSDISSQADLEALVRKIGLDVAATKDLVKSQEIGRHLEQSYQLGQEIGVGGTPTFIVVDTPVVGDTMDKIETVVNRVRDRKKG
jgi:protein-disulfide isomerase